MIPVPPWRVNCKTVSEFPSGIMSLAMITSLVSAILRMAARLERQASLAAAILLLAQNIMFKSRADSKIQVAPSLRSGDQRESRPALARYR